MSSLEDFSAQSSETSASSADDISDSDFQLSRDDGDHHSDDIEEDYDDKDDFSDEDSDDIIFSAAPDVAIDSNMLRSQDIAELDSIEHQMDILRQQGYQFENPHHEEDDRWYNRFVQGQVDLDESTDEDNDISYGFPTANQQQLTDQSIELDNQPLLALPDPRNESPQTHSAQPSHPSLPMQDQDKQGVQEMVTKQLLVAASLHALEMAALDLRVQPRQVDDINNLDFHERQSDLQRQQIKAKLQQRTEQQYKDYQDEQEIIAQAEAQGLNPDEALAAFKLQKQQSQASTTTTTTTGTDHSLETNLIREAREQLSLLDEMKPSIHHGQIESGINIFHIFNPEYTIAPYIQQFQHNPPLQQTFLHFQTNFTAFSSKYLTQPSSSLSSPHSTNTPFNLLSSLHIPPQYAYVSHMINSKRHFDSLPHRTPLSAPQTLPSISSQLSSMLLMKEIQRTGILSTKLTLYHVLDTIVRICDEDFCSFSPGDVDLFYSHKSTRQQLLSEANPSRSNLLDHIDTTTTTSTALPQLSQTISELNNSKHHGSPKKHSLGREILATLLSTSPSLDSTSPRQRSILLNQTYLECVLLRQSLYDSWKCHDEQYNDNATEMFQNRKSTGETPYFASPPSTLSSFSQLSQQSSSTLNELTTLTNPTGVPPLPLWIYCVSQNTIMVMMLLFIIHDTFIDINNNNNNNNDINQQIQQQQLRYLNLTPPPKLTITAMNQDYETEKDQHDAHCALIDNITQIKATVHDFLTINLDATSSSTAERNDNKSGDHDDDDDDSDLPLLLVSDWDGLHKSTINTLTTFVTTRFPALVLPTVPIQIPFLVISILNNDAEDKAAVRKRVALDAIRQANTAKLPINDDAGDGGAADDHGDGSDSSRKLPTQKKGKKAMKGKKRLQKSKQDQKLAASESNLWKESYISTGQDSQDQINDKLEKTAAFEKEQEALQTMLQTADEYSPEELTWLYQHQDFFYPWSFPFTPKLPMIPCSAFQYSTISNYFSHQLRQWEESRNQILAFIQHQEQLLLQQSPSQPPPSQPKQPKPKTVRATNKVDDALNNLDADDANEADNSDQEGTEVVIIDPAMVPGSQLLQLPRISATATALPNENFGNLTTSSLLELCQQGSEQYKNHLQRQRAKLLQERGTDTFTEQDLNNLQLFPNAAADNAYSYVRSKQQRLEERQERRKRRKFLKEQKKQKLAEKIASNQAVGFDDAVGTMSRLDLLELKSKSINGGNTSSETMSSDQTTTGDEDSHSSAKLIRGIDHDHDNDDFSPSTTDITSSDDDAHDEQQVDAAPPPPSSNKRLLNDSSASSAASSSQTPPNNPDQPIVKSSSSKTYNKLPVSLTLLEHQTISDAMGIDNPSNDFQYTSGLNQDVTATSFTSQQQKPGSSHKQTEQQIEYDPNDEDPADPRTITNISRSGHLLFPLIQTIPFVFDTVSQVASYSGAPAGFTSSLQLAPAKNLQQHPLRMFKGRWIIDGGVSIQDKTICLFSKNWDQ